MTENEERKSKGRVQRDMFYDDEAMMKMNIGDIEDIYAPQNQFEHYK